MPSNPSRLWWIAAPVLLALALAVPGCGGGGGGGSGATFVKAFGGSGMRSAAGLIPLSDGYLLVGGGSGFALARLDGNGGLVSAIRADVDSVDVGQISHVVPLGGDRSLAITGEGVVLQLERDDVVSGYRSAPTPQGDYRLQLLPNGQRYLIQDVARRWGSTRWTYRELDSRSGGTEGPQVAQAKSWAVALPGGDVLLVSDNDQLPTGAGQDLGSVPADGEVLRLERLSADGSAQRWLAFHTLDTGLGESPELRVRHAAALLPDGKLLIVRSGEQGAALRLIKVDPDTGSVLLHRALRPASGGYLWNWPSTDDFFSPGLDPRVQVTVTPQGQVWLGFTSATLIWNQTVVVNGSRQPVPYGGKNIALIRLDEALQPDRLRVYGAGGDETLMDLQAAADGGLLVSGATRSFGLYQEAGDLYPEDALVMRLNADGLVEGNCRMLLKRLEGAEAAQYLGTSAPLGVQTPDPQPRDVLWREIFPPGVPSTTRLIPEFLPAALQQPPAVCLAGLGEVPPAPAGTPPIADAGPDQSVAPLATVTLAGSGTDSDGAVVGYAWTQLSGPPVTLGGADTPTATFTAPAGTEAQVLTFQLTVTDDTGRTGSDGVVVTVGTPSGPPNVAPTANAGADLAATVGQTVTLAGQGSDSDGSVVAYAWRQLSGPAVSLSGAGSASASFTAPTVTSAQVLRFQLTVTDDDGATGSDTVDVTVQPAPTTGSVTLTVIIDGGPGAALVRTGEQPTPQLDCRIAYETTVTCTTLYAVGTDVALYGEAFAALNMDWTGCTRGLDDLERPVCRVTMDSDRTVRVHLRPLYTLALTITGQPNRGAVVFSTGSTATGSGANLYCVSPDAAGTTCWVDIPEGDTLLLDWSNPTGFGVQAWSGCTPERDANNRLVCRLTMDRQHEVTATFGP